MKNLKSINDFFKMYENSNNDELFKKPELLKSLLMKDEDFGNGNIISAFVNIAYTYWSNFNKKYSDFVGFIEQEFGEFFLFIFMFEIFNRKSYNGGFESYFYEGYASSENTYRGVYNNIDLHHNFVELFEFFNMNKILDNGEKTLDIISNYNLELIEDVEMCNSCKGSGSDECYNCYGMGSTDCEVCNGSGKDFDGESCENCDGEGYTECPECKGIGKTNCSDCGGEGEIDLDKLKPDISDWETLDLKWFKIQYEVMSNFNDYLKKLYINNEKIGDLVERSIQSKKYNI